MKNEFNLKQNQVIKLKGAIDLLYVAAEMLKEVYNEDDLFPKELEELDEKGEQIGDIAFNLASKFEPTHEYKDFLQADIVQRLSSGLSDMTELDEVKMTFETIKTVINGNPNKKLISDMLNWDIRQEERKAFLEYALTEKFREDQDIR